MHGTEVVGHEAPLGHMDMDGVMRTPNMEGGTDLVRGGQTLSHSTHNAMGGHDVYHGLNLHHVTVPNAHGGVDVYDSNMHLEGYSMDNGMGGEFYFSTSGNMEEISQYDDPLAHSAECKFDPFNINGKK